MKQGLKTGALLAALALLVTACENPSGNGGSGAPFVAVTEITGVPAAGTAGVNLPLTGTVTPANAAYITIVWSVKDGGTTGAAITGNVLSTAGAGTVTVTATIVNGTAIGTAYTQDFSITITTGSAGFVAVTGITGVPATGTAGTPLPLTGTVTPADATNQTIAWTVKTDGGTGAAITGNTLTTTGAGTVTLTAAIPNGLAIGTAYTRDFPITITTGSAGFVAVTGITDGPEAGTVGIPLTLSGTVTPANATNQTILWSVKNAGGTGAAITNGNTLTSAAAGTVVVTATIANGTAIGTAYTQDFTITIFATPAQYRELILATPDAVSPVTITGDSAYNASDNDTLFPSGRTVTVSPFKIAKYETTYELWYEVRQWAADSARGANRYVFGNAGREGHDGTDGAAPSSGTARTEPVTTINWRDAVIWCNAYSEREGKEPVYYTDTGYTTVLRTSTNESGTATAADGAVMKTTANGYRLPTEAQWEYAARGGKAPSTSGSFANKWAGTDTESALGNYAWYSSNSSSATHAAGGKLGNTLGLYDMSGNVWEWCWDWYSSSVGTGTVTDPTGAFAGSNRVVRGGSWGISASGCAVAYRSSYIPRSRYGNVGFRVVARP